MYQYLVPSDLGLKNSQVVQFPISNISSKKILHNKFKSIVNTEEIDENISFYKLVNKFSPEVAPEDTVDLLQIIKGGVKMEILNDSVKSFEKLYLQLQDGFPVIVPTDTNYNLCSLPNNDLCIDKIFEYKKRSKDKPLSLFIDKPEDWKLYGDNQNTEIVDKLVEIFWPGPLNIILKIKQAIIICSIIQIV